MAQSYFHTNFNDLQKAAARWGGKREGSGRPRQFEEPTTINFKCELSDKLAAKEKHGKALNQMFIEWLKSVIKLGNYI